MNTLEATILDQHLRVRAAGSNPLEALAEAQGEILMVATPELTLEILKKEIGYRSLTGLMREQNDPSSARNRMIQQIRNGHGLARVGMINPNNGYTGGIIFDSQDRLVVGNSMDFRGIKLVDPIQDAMGTVFYPPMMWAKALRGEAYKNRADSARKLSIAEYLSKLGLSLGSVVTKYGDIMGATGFMPGERLMGTWDDEQVNAHIASEEIEAFRRSGLCDQSILDPDILMETPAFTSHIVKIGGRLN